MRIGFDITPLSVPQSGVGTYAANLYDQLCQRQEDEVLPLTHRPNTDRWSGNGAHKSRFTINRTLWMQVLLPIQLGQIKPDVVHFTNSTAPVLSPYPTVMTIHDMTLWLMPEYHPAPRLAAMRPIIPLAARRAAAVITVSESAKADILQILHLPDQQVHVIYEAPAQEFRPITSGLDVIREKYHLPPRFILYVGTIEPRKNLSRLLEAFSMLRQSNEVDHELVMVGSKGWKDDAIYASLEQLDLQHVVHFLGYIPTEDLAAIYNLADALTFPSLYEGFGLPVIEAMACGTPVITSPCGSLPEVAGDAAEFVDPLDIHSIAEGIRCVLTNRSYRTQLRERGLMRAAALSWAGVAEQTHHIYEMVC